jgi:hypothetical protein
VRQVTEKGKSCCQFTQSAACRLKEPRKPSQKDLNLEHFLLEQHDVEGSGKVQKQLA